MIQSTEPNEQGYLFIGICVIVFLVLKLIHINAKRKNKKRGELMKKDNDDKKENNPDDIVENGDMVGIIF